MMLENDLSDKDIKELLEHLITIDKKEDINKQKIKEILNDPNIRPDIKKIVKQFGFPFLPPNWILIPQIKGFINNDTEYVPKAVQVIRLLDDKIKEKQKN